MRMIGRLMAAGVLAFALVAAAGCGEKTDVSQGVEETNKQLAAQGAELDCPDEVDGGEGTKFDCDLKSTTGDASETIELEVTKTGDAYGIETVDRAKFNEALAKVAGGGAEEEAAPEEEAVPEE